MTSEFGSLAIQPRTAIVTGGARRIGAALTAALREDGWTVLVHCHHSCDEAGHFGDGVATVAADLAEPDAADRILAALGPLPPPGLLVNNASRFVLDTLDDFDVAGWEAHMAANLRAPALLTQAFARARCRRGRGG